MEKLCKKKNKERPRDPNNPLKRKMFIKTTAGLSVKRFKQWEEVILFKRTLIGFY